MHSLEVITLLQEKRASLAYFKRSLHPEDGFEEDFDQPARHLVVRDDLPLDKRASLAYFKRAAKRASLAYF
ncbi:hypothetical protein Ciccas_005065 [Cichlidogyrus casuarinus]|uniref:Uncharacterized protein n=1 Tax=Cichlidogyrus casuarinus TaxID=1844966 RepID=A0ABD2Q9T1_9PLAT